MRRHVTCLTACATLLAAVGLALAAESPVAPTPRPAGENFVQTLKVATRPDAMAGGREKEGRFEMGDVPGGEVTLGSPADEPGRGADQGPRHRVRVGGFWMGKCEVTWDEYDLFRADEQFPLAIDEQGRKLGPDAVTRPSASFVDETYDHGREGHPALCITHHAAMMYCN